MTDRTVDRIRSANLASAGPSRQTDVAVRATETKSIREGARPPMQPARSGQDEITNVEAEVRSLKARSGLGLWVVVVFVAMSLWAHSGFRYFPEIPEGWHDWLGAPPPLNWIHGIFLLYIFSALVLSLTRMAGAGHPYCGFSHLGYLAAFYGFYHIAGGLADNFWAVLIGGLSVLGLEGYRNLLQCQQKIRDRRGEGN